MELLRHLPPKTGMAFVIVQHLDPHHACRLPKLLSKVTTMPVIELADAAKPRPNREYSLRVRPCYTTDNKKERYAGKTSNRPKQVF